METHHNVINCPINVLPLPRGRVWGPGWHMPSEGRSSFEYLDAPTTAAASAEAATEGQEVMGAANEERDVGGGP